MKTVKISNQISNINIEEKEITNSNETGHEQCLKKSVFSDLLNSISKEISRHVEIKSTADHCFDTLLTMINLIRASMNQMEENKQIENTSSLEIYVQNTDSAIQNVN